MNINKFLETGNNKTIVKIIDAVVIAILSVISLYFVVNMIGASTGKDYLNIVGKNILLLIIFGGVDFLIILFTKPLFGFTSVFENVAAAKKVRASEKAAKEQDKADEKAFREKLRAERKARKLAEKNAH